MSDTPRTDKALARIAEWEDTTISDTHSVEELRKIERELNALKAEAQEYVYNGEPASDFGLEEDSKVLWWNGIEFDSNLFCHLEIGDTWRKMPDRESEVGE